MVAASEKISIREWTAVLAPAYWKAYQRSQVRSSPSTSSPAASEQASAAEEGLPPWPPIWPPDAFAIVGSILQKTGAYLQLTTFWPPKKHKNHTAWLKVIDRVSHAWMLHILSEEGFLNNDKAYPFPKELREWWDTLLSVEALAISDLLPDPDEEESRVVDVQHALLQILAVADHISSELGIQLTSDQWDNLFDDFQSIVGKPWKAYTDDRPNPLSLLLPEDAGADLLQDGLQTLCIHVPADRVRVLPKQRTPQSGLTLRSLTHNLALCESTQVTPAWHAVNFPLTDSGKSNFNLLILPWPDVVLPVDFSPIEDPAPESWLNSAQCGLFSYQRREQIPQLLERIEKTLKAAQTKITPIHAIVFPELSLLNREYDHVVSLLDSLVESNTLRQETPPILIAGIIGEAADRELGRNFAICNVPTQTEDTYWEQDKHHRWFLERNQITRYGLGTRLDPNRKWWEAMSLSQRKLHFLSLASWMSLCVLICEDLARPDPVADIVRAVGPNLVIALLLDGPQKENRWSARYASVLADDPGSSVLTVTCLGMVELSRDLKTQKVERKVALWRDSVNGTVELELPTGANGLVLCLSDYNNEHQPEFTADGRSDFGRSSIITLTGVHAV